MADIEAAAAKLIAALYVPEAMDEDPIASMPASLRYGALQAQAALEAGHGPPKRSGTGLLRDSVHGVYRLHRWAETAKRRWAETYKRDSNQPDRPHAQSDMSAMKNWIVYLEVWPVSGRVYSSAGSQHP
jgi:hypothetical protein